MDETQEIEPVGGPEPSAPRRVLGKRTKIAAGVVAAALVATALVGVGMAVGSATSPSDSMAMDRTSAAAHKAGAAKDKAKGKGEAAKQRAAREAWARQYGQNRDTMPNLPDVGSATDAQRTAAMDLLTQTEADTAAYSDLNAAKAAGYDLPAALAKAEAKNPKLKTVLAAIDSGKMPKRMPMLHVANVNARTFAVLDPSHPQTLMYEYEGNGNWKLIGVMYTATKAFPKAPPDPGGPITRWHYHPKNGGAGLMMHIFFVPGNDLAHAYALTMS